MRAAIQQLQEYSDELIRNGISPEEYMTNISVKMWTMLVMAIIGLIAAWFRV